jgi:hypothetical protein
MPCRHWNERRFYHGFSRNPAVWKPVWLARIPNIKGLRWFKKSIAETNAATEWLHTNPDTCGFYWCETTWPDWAKPGEGVHMSEVGHTFMFTDADTAFAFKMRFG